MSRNIAVSVCYIAVAVAHSVKINLVIIIVVHEIKGEINAAPKDAQKQVNHISSFIKGKPEITNGLICCVIAVIAIVQYTLKNRGDSGRRRLSDAIRSVDFATLLQLTGLFLVIQGITDIGLIDDAAGAIADFGGSNMFLLYTVIVWGSVIFSAFIDNIPYVATMLPVITGICASLHIEPYLLYFGLLTGATLGGNLTPFGASANIAATGLLRKEGWKVGLRDFARIGIPFTLTAVAAGYVFIWAFWH